MSSNELSGEGFNFDHGLVREAAITRAHDKFLDARQLDAAIEQATVERPGSTPTRHFIIEAQQNQAVPAEHRRIRLEPKSRHEALDGIRTVTVRIPIAERTRRAEDDMISGLFSPQVTDFDPDGFLTKDVFVELTTEDDAVKRYLLNPEGLFQYENVSQIEKIPDPEFWQHSYAVKPEGYRLPVPEPVETEELFDRLFNDYELFRQDNTLPRSA
jgi:hypothetical protein